MRTIAEFALAVARGEIPMPRIVLLSERDYLHVVDALGRDGLANVLYASSPYVPEGFAVAKFQAS